MSCTACDHVRGEKKKGCPGPGWGREQSRKDGQGTPNTAIPLFMRVKPRQPFEQEIFHFVDLTLTLLWLWNATTRIYLKIVT